MDKESVQNHAAQLTKAVHEMADNLDSGVAINARRAEMVRSLGDLPAALERLFTHRAAMDLVTAPPAGQVEAVQPEPAPTS